jgi:hypothetical protein
MDFTVSWGSAAKVALGGIFLAPRAGGAGAPVEETSIETNRTSAPSGGATNHPLVTSDAPRAKPSAYSLVCEFSNPGPNLMCFSFLVPSKYCSSWGKPQDESGLLLRSAQPRAGAQMTEGASKLAAIESVDGVCRAR